VGSVSAWYLIRLIKKKTFYPEVFPLSFLLQSKKKLVQLIYLNCLLKLMTLPFRLFRGKTSLKTKRVEQIERSIKSRVDVSERLLLQAKEEDKR